MNVRAIREALAAAVDGLGFRVYDVLPDNAELPAVVVGWPEQIAYSRTGTGGADVDLAVTVAVPRTDWAAAQEALDEALAPAVIVAAILGHPTTAWDGIAVTTAGNIRPIDVPAALAADLNITVYVN